MKFLLSFITFCFLQFSAQSQELTYDEVKTVFPDLQKENFKSAFKKTNELLQSHTIDSSDLRGLLNYINIYAAAGMVSKNEMTHDEFTKHCNRFLGQYLVMAGHPCVDSTKNGFNVLKFVNNNGVTEGMIASANANGTSIFCFEKFSFAEAIEPNSYIGKTVRCGGFLQKLETNPNNSTVWISRLFIRDAFLRTL